jgi:radical SAM protein with 4Fe4S-binding SPASM domain
LRIVTIRGPGGVGKTRLLEEIQRELGVWEGPPAARIACSELVDLIDPWLHLRMGFIRALRESLRWMQRFSPEFNFINYEIAWERFERQVLDNVEYRLIQQAAREAMRAFWEDYGRLTERWHIVWLVDTVEQLALSGSRWFLENELLSEEQVQFQTTRWLLQTIRDQRLKNTTLILPGRSTEGKPFFEQIQQAARESNIPVQDIELSPLTPDGVRAFLQPEDADWIAAEGIQVMISLDGIGEQHDLLRSSRGGRGTFSRVEQTVDQILIPRGVRPAITMTITGLNAMAAADVARWALIERDLALSFNFYRRNILSASRSELELEEQRIIEGLLAAYAVIETHLPSRPFFNGLLDHVHAGSHAHPCGAGHDYLVITHRGEFAQCHMLLEQPVRTNPDGDPLLAIRYGPLQNPRGDEKEGCQSCPFRFHCAGGCPLETYRATGRWDMRSPHCRIYQTLLPAALRLEGLRLMKIHGYL